MLPPAPLLLERLGDRLEVRPVDELHDDEVRVVADADVEDLHAVRMREVRAEARLVQEHRDELLLLREMREDALDRDLLAEALQAFALGAKHLRHAARFELFDDAVSLLGGFRHGADKKVTRRFPKRQYRCVRDVVDSSRLRPDSRPP